MDPYLLTVKYIFNKNQKENHDTSIADFFSNSRSFPQFVSIILGKEIPGLTNKIFNDNNNRALKCLIEKDNFFDQFSLTDPKQQISLVMWTLDKIYFKADDKTIIQKLNNYLPNNQIKNFSDFSDGVKFIYLLESMCGQSILNEKNDLNKKLSIDQVIELLSQCFKSFNIPTILCKDEYKSSTLNKDSVKYQLLIILDSKIQPTPKLEKTDVIPSQQPPKTTSNDSKQKKVSSSDIDNQIKSQSKAVKPPCPRLKYNQANNEKQIPLNFNSSNNSTMESLISSEIIVILKSSYINIVNHLLKQASTTKEIINIKNFSEIEKGTILPKLIKILFKEEVPNLITKPIGNDQLSNNMNCLYFIRSKYPFFNPENYKLKNEEDLKKLIRFMINKCIYSDKFIEQMKIECNSILSKFNIKITNFNKDWENGKKFIALLDSLSEGKVTFLASKEVTIEELQLQFKSAQCDFIIGNDSLFQTVDEFVIKYQIKIILQSFGKLTEIEEPKSIDKYHYLYVKDSTPILRVMNVIGSSIGIRYDSMDDIINGMTLHLLIKHLLNISEIPGIEQDENKNVDSVINFLKTKNNDFKNKAFDFDIPTKRNENILSFTTILLKQFFLKQSRTEMINAVSNLTGKKLMSGDIKQFFKYGKGFCEIFGIKNDENIQKYDEKLILDTFQINDIPYILDENSLTDINDDNILYQLQIIFDEKLKRNEPINIFSLNSSRTEQMNQQNKPLNSINKKVEEFFKVNRNDSVEIFHFNTDSLFMLSEEINFNKQVYDRFRSNYNINKNDDSIYIAFIAGYNVKEVPELIKLLSDKPIESVKSDNFEARLYYCGRIGKILKYYKSFKKNKQDTNSRLACISITGQSDANIEDFLYFESAIASQCDLIIIPEMTQMNDKLRRILTFNEKAKVSKSTIKEPQFFCMYDYSYNINDDYSCKNFVTSLINSIYFKSNSFDDYFKNMKDQAPSRYFICIFQNFDNKGFLLNECKKNLIVKEFVDIAKKNKTEQYSTKPIYQFFSKYQIAFQQQQNIVDNLIYLSALIIDEFVNDIAKTIQETKLDGIKPSSFCKEIETFLINEVTYIDDDYFEMLKDSVIEKIKDFIYDDVKKNCENCSISYDMIVPIYKRKLKNCVGFIDDCMNYIDELFQKNKLEVRNDAKLNEYQLAQDSMKYVLAVKESMKELTVEIVSDDKLEDEIETDF